MNRKQQISRNRTTSNHSRRHGRRRTRRSQVLPTIVALTLFSLTLVCVVMAMSPRGSTKAQPVQAQADGAGSPQTVERMIVTLQPQVTPEPTPEPTPTPAPTAVPTPESTVEPTPETLAFEYLPVVRDAYADAYEIAITVDDCYQLDNLETIVNLAVKKGGKLTLFPVGENLSKTGMSKLLKHCAFDLGFEIENHTWSHDRIFRLPDEEMAAEIWKQSAALNQTLGVNYQEHFLRLMGGDGETDPRIHSYLKKMGFTGIASWSVSGSDSDMASIKSSLAPGQIYLFHTTDADTKKLKEFIPYAVSKGYKLVTLNHLLDLPDNEVTPLTESAMPQPERDVNDYHTLKVGEYTWATVQLQDKLRSLGYLQIDGPSTGYYGKQTAEAISAFQEASGLPATGEADEQTQRLLMES